jgi:hypothetical protein
MDVSALSVAELLKAHAAIQDELRAREVVRSSNNPVSDLAELLFCRSFNRIRQGNSRAGHDAADADGLLYQVKGRRLSLYNTSRQLSAIRKLPLDPFHYLGGVLFDHHFGVLRAALIPLAVVKARATRDDYTNSWRFLLQDDVWDEPGVRDATEPIRCAAMAL